MLDVVQNWSLEHRDLKHFVEISLVFLAYIIAGKLGQATTNIRSSNLGPVWPAYGIALAAILICGYRVWPAVLTGAFVVAFFSPVPHLAALGQATGATLAATSGAFVLHRITDFHRSLSRLTDVLSLIFLGGFGSATVSASIGTLVLFSTHVHAYSGLGSAWLIYWLGDATGVLLVTPLVLRTTDFFQLRDRDRIAELVALISLLVVTCLIIFGDLASIPIKLDVLAFAVLPFVIWAAIRFGLGVTAFTILVVATIATIETALGTGPFATNTNFVNAVLLDIFFGVLSVSGLSLAAVISEREYAEHQREQVINEQAALEAQLHASKALRESEERLRLAAQAGRMYAYDWDVTTDRVVRSEEAIHILGPSSQPLTLTRQQLIARVHPDDRAIFIAAVDSLRPEKPITRITYRVSRPDGSITWLEKHGRAFFDSQGKMLRIIGMVADVTERKLAEQALSEMSRKLIEAQEQERSRIGRELHDDINQRLAMLAVELRQLQQNPSAVENSVKELTKQVVEISNDVQALSHDLHASKLEYLGVVAGMRSWCKDTSERQNIDIDFRSNVADTLPLEIGISLFRVLQEALHNAVKHSGVKRMQVQVMEHSGEIQLSVSDSGKGFDVEAASRGKGLGLTSMKERVRLINGTISIESKPTHGTAIHVRVPLEPEKQSKQKAG